MDARVDAGPAGDAGGGGPGDGGVGPGTCEAVNTDAGHGPLGDAPGCDLSGVWIGRQTAESLALTLPQYASTWYVLELQQTGNDLAVTAHLDCGIEVQGTVNVQLTPATTNALIRRNSQVGRKGIVTRAGNDTCAVSLERFYSVRGVSEATYAPAPRSSSVSLEGLRLAQPLPPSGMPGATEDWDSDGKPGIAWTVSGFVSGVRHTAQRDWTVYFTAPGYTVPASSEFAQDLVIRAAFAAEEVVYEADSPTLRQLSQPNCAAPHTMTLRFLGKSRADARAQQIFGADDAITCANVRAALPAPKSLQ